MRRTIFTVLQYIRRMLHRLSATYVARPGVAASPDDARAFVPTTEGSGIFGQWSLDDVGLPAYRYTLDQYQDARARYANTENLDRRDHWHQIGNDRVTALVSNDGVIQVYMADRGGVFLNRFEARDFETHPGHRAPPLSLGARLSAIAGGILFVLMRLARLLRSLWYRLRASAIRRKPPVAIAPRGSASVEPTQTPGVQKLSGDDPHAYAGGFGYLDDGNEVWATAFRYRPAGSQVERTFGIGHCDTTSTYRNIRVSRQAYAPAGDDPLLLCDVRIENMGSAPVDLHYYEYWDVNIQRLKLQWLRAGMFAAAGDEERRALNDVYIPDIALDSLAKVLRFYQCPAPGAAIPLPDQVSDVDRQPLEVFLADLGDRPIAACYTDKAAFFGQSGAKLPDAARAHRPGDMGPFAPANPMPHCLVMRHDIHLEPGASQNLRYAYGTIRPNQSLAFLDRYRTGDVLGQSLAVWKDRLAYFSASDDSRVLQREMAWHAHNLLSATVYNAYYDTHLVPQGSAYLYLHGADGAPRDQALFAMPLAYLRPDLARDILRLIMSMTVAATGAIPYAFAGYGYNSDGMGIHAAPSDLDLFFMLALTEYLAATGDLGFLGVRVPFYPRGAQPAPWIDITVLEHLRVAMKHLTASVGTGEHGLIKIGDGDWSDGIVFESAVKDGLLGVNFENSRQNGESVPNSQMALYVLPRLAAILDPQDSDLAGEMRQLAARLETAVMVQWNGQWFNRAVLRDNGDNPVLIGEDWISLESQPWALISGVAARMGRQGVEARLIDTVSKLLDDPSPIGAPTSERGMVWPAISQLLTWGYTRSRQDLAWRSLNRHTFNARARAFPTRWFSVWSGPDAIHAADSSDPGGTWHSLITPMTDFPVMNANQDAMALLALMRVCGVEPAPGGDGLTIAPQAPPERFVLDLPLIRLDVAPGRIAGEYRAVVDGTRVLHVRPPGHPNSITATIDGLLVPSSMLTGDGVALLLTFKAGQRVAFEVRWS